MKTFLLLLLFSLPLQAAQEISECATWEVIGKLQPRFTRNTMTSVPYGWVRYISVPGQFTCGGGLPTVYPVSPFGKQRVCYLAPLTTETDFIATVFPLTNSTPGAIRSITNPANGIWFVTNAVGIEQDQASLDWCTQ